MEENVLFSCFLKEIESDNLVKKGDRVLVAVSGGADSVCLLHLFVRLRDILDLQLICAHVHHGLRTEADDEAEFVKKLCKEWDVPFVMHKADVGALAKEKKISIELAGREVRYSFFRSVYADIILTAHTKNDVAETVLLHMIRGCGVQGLCGIPRIRDDGIYRPLLHFTREQIEAYLLSHQITWCEDKSNNDSIYARNKVRHEILPPILAMNPSFLDAASRMTEIVAEENQFMKEATDKYNCITQTEGICRISLKCLSKMPKTLQKRAILNLVENAEEVRMVLELCEKENGKRISLSGGKTAEKAYDEIILFDAISPMPAPVKLPMQGDVLFGRYRISVGEEGLELPQKEYWVRTRKNGDTFSPEGLSGHKKIKDFLNEKKVPHFYRDEVPIIMHNDKIAAVGDWRRDNDYLPHDAKTIRIKIQRI